ncbi:MAG: hypothetical protein OHK0053_01730 [Microscillaceae bacterium]
MDSQSPDLHENTIQHIPSPKPVWASRLLWGLLMAFLVGLVWVNVWMYYYFMPYIKTRLEEAVYKQTKGEYILNIHQMRFNLLSARLSAQDLTLHRRLPSGHKGYYKPQLVFETQSLDMLGVYWLRYWRTGELKIEKLRVQKPVLHLETLYQKRRAKGPSFQLDWAETRLLIQGFAQRLQIKDWQLEGLQLNFPQSLAWKIQPVKGLQIGGQALDLNPRAGADFSKSLRWEEFFLKLPRLSGQGPHQQRFSVSNLRVSTHDSMLLCQNLQWRSGQLADSLFLFKLDGHLRFFKMKGLDYARILFKRQVVARDLQLSQGHIAWMQMKSLSPGFSLARFWPNYGRNFPLYLKLDSVKIEDISFKRYQINRGQKRPVLTHRAEHFQLYLQGLAWGDALPKAHVPRAVVAQGLQFEVSPFVFNTPEGLYQTYFEKIAFSSRDSMLRLHKIHHRPLVSETHFSAHQPYQHILLSARIEKVEAFHLNLEKLAYRQEFIAQDIRLEKADFEAYLDKTKPKNPQQVYANFEELLKDLPLYIYADRFALKKGKLVYKEKRYLETLGPELPSLSAPTGLAQHRVGQVDAQIRFLSLGKAFRESALSQLQNKSLVLEMAQYQFVSADEAYQFSVQQLTANARLGLLRLDSLRLRPRAEAQAFSEQFVYQTPWVSVKVGRVEAQNIDYSRLLLRQEIDWGRLTLWQPNVAIYIDRRKIARPVPPSEWPIVRNDLTSWLQTYDGWQDKMLKTLQALQKPAPPSEGSRIYQRPLQALAPASKPDLRAFLRNIPVFIKVDTLQIAQGVLYLGFTQFTQTGSGRSWHQAQNINLLIPQIRLGYATQDTTFRHFYSGNILLTLQDYAFLEPNNRYIFRLKGVQSSLDDSLLRAEALDLQPFLNKKDFLAASPYRQLYSEAHLRRLQANAIDLDRLVFEQELVLKSLHIEEPDLYFYQDKTKPPPPGPAPQNLEEILAEIPLYVRIDTLALSRGKLRYEQKKAEGRASPDSLARHRIEAFDFSAHQVELASAKTKQALHPETRLMYSRDLQFHIRDYSYLTPDGQYRAGFKHLSAQAYDSSLVMEGLFYKPLLSESQFEAQAKAQDARYEVEIHTLRARLRDPSPLFDFSAFPFSSLQAHGGHIDIYQNRTLPPDSLTSEVNLPNLVRKIPFNIQIDTLGLQGIQLHFRQKNASEDKARPQWAEHWGDSLFVWAQGFSLDSLARQSTKRFLFCESLQAGLGGYYTLLDQERYQLRTGRVFIRSDDSSMVVKNLRLAPTVPDETFMRLKLFQTDRFEVDIPEARLRNLRLSQWLQTARLQADLLNLHEAKVNVYRDKRIERRPDWEPFLPNAAFQQLPFEIQLDTMDFDDTFVSYRERVFKGRTAGEVFFDRINGQVYDLNNSPGSKDTVRLVASCWLMGAGLLTARLQMDLHSPQLYCTYYGSLGSMKADFFNQIIETNEGIRIRKGQIQQINYEVVLKDSLALGRIEAGYENLKIDVLRQENPGKKRGFLTMLANMILKNRNNLQKRNFKVGQVRYVWDKQVGFIGILWKSLATGLVDTLK